MISVSFAFRSAALKQGDFRYNIVVHPDDLILVRPPITGEYYMGGHISRTGVYSLTARKITLIQAVVAAGDARSVGGSGPYGDSPAS